MRVQDPAFRRKMPGMEDRQLHPREESYRWAIQKLDEVFGRDSVRVTPRHHYHVITVTVTSSSGKFAELPLRNPSYDLNRQKDREKIVERWIAETRERFGEAPRPAAVGAGSSGRASRSKR